MLTGIITVFYILFLHNTDVISLSKRKERIQLLENEINRKKIQIEDLKVDLTELQNTNSLEKFAREKYYFKKDDEDIFILSDQ